MSKRPTKTCDMLKYPVAMYILRPCVGWVDWVDWVDGFDGECTACGCEGMDCIAIAVTTSFVVFSS